MKLERVLTTIFFLLIIIDNLKSPAKQQVTEQTQQPQQEQQNQQVEQEIPITQQNQQQEEEVYSEDAEYIETTLPINVEILYCNRTGLHTQYQELERNIYLTFPKNKNLAVTPGEYPVSEMNQQLSKFINYGQYGVMALMFFHKQVFGLFQIPVPAIVEKIVEKKMFVLMGIIFLVSYLQNILLTTGKMQVYVDTKLVFDQAAPIQVDKYTDNQEEVTLDQLQDYLKEQGHYNEESFNQNVEVFQQLIDELIQDDSEHTYEKYGVSASELHQTWLTEKDRVLSYYIKTKTQGQKIEKFQWSVNNQFYSKRAKNINQPVCIMNLKAKDVVNKTYKFHTFEINEDDLTYVEDQFKKIEQTINALLL